MISVGQEVSTARLRQAVLTSAVESAIRNYLISVLHERQCVRRLALSVPQSAQRLYILRANRLVMTALKTRMPPMTAMLKSVSFNLCISLSTRAGNSARAHTRAGKRRFHKPHYNALEDARLLLHKIAHAPADAAPPQNRDDRLARPP
jgi:hypothetical protein